MRSDQNACLMGQWDRKKMTRGYRKDICSTVAALHIARTGCKHARNRQTGCFKLHGMLIIPPASLARKCLSFLSTRPLLAGS